MKLIVEITTRDEKTERHRCVDFPSYSGDFVILYKPNFLQERIRTETILGTKQYFE